MTSVYHLRICSSSLSPALLPTRSGDWDICYLTMCKKVWSALATKQITQWERGSNGLLVVTVAREITSSYSVWQQPQVFFFFFFFFFFFCQCHRSEVCSEAWRSKFIMKQTTSQIEVIKMQKRKNSGYQLPWCFKVCKWSWRRRFCCKGPEYELGVGCPCWSKSRVALGSDSMPCLVQQTASPLLSTNG